MSEPSYDECLVEAELRARAAYAEPHRHYHDQRHLDECLRRLEAVPDLRQRERRLLRWAILWHDAIYDPSRDDNEQLSAALAERELTGCGIETTEATEVARLILLTRAHHVGEGDRLGALMVSIDLAILGSDAGRYAAYVAAVRREYAHLPNETWREGRSAVLNRLLEADPLFPEPRFRAELEAVARSNMREELSSLAAS